MLSVLIRKILKNKLDTYVSKMIRIQIRISYCMQYSY